MTWKISASCETYAGTWRWWDAKMRGGGRAEGVLQSKFVVRTVFYYIDLFWGSIKLCHLNSKTYRKEQNTNAVIRVRRRVSLDRSETCYDYTNSIKQSRWIKLSLKWIQNKILNIKSLFLFRDVVYASIAIGV